MQNNLLIKKKSDEILPLPPTASLSHDDFAHALRVSPWGRYALNMYGEAFERELQCLLQAYSQIQSEDHRRAFQSLVLQGVVDMAGYYTKRCCGVSWRRCVAIRSGLPEEYRDGNVSVLVPEREDGPSVYDITVQEIQSTQYVAGMKMFRPKLTGQLFFRKNDKLIGSFSIPAPPNIDEVEFVDGVFHVISPPLYAAFEHYGYKFVPHPWSTIPCPSSEGLIVLVNGQERRLKRNPSIEILIQGGFHDKMPVVGAPLCDYPMVGEVVWYDNQLYFLRERYGKTPMPIVKLHKLASLAMLPDLGHGKVSAVCQPYLDACKLLKNGTLTNLRYTPGAGIVLVSSMTFLGVLPMVDEVSQAIQWLERLLAHNGHVLLRYSGVILPLTKNFHYLHSEQLVVRGSVKMTFMTPKGVAIFKDGDKAWDFIGGKIDYNESPNSALEREILEESGCTVPASDFRFLTTIVSAEVSTLYETFLYVYTGKDQSFMRKFSVYDASAICVPWFPNYLSALPELATIDIDLPETDDVSAGVTLPGIVKVDMELYYGYARWADHISRPLFSSDSHPAPKEGGLMQLPGLTVTSNRQKVLIRYLVIPVYCRVGLYLRTLDTTKQYSMSSLAPLPWQLNSSTMQQYARLFGWSVRDGILFRPSG